SAPNPIAPNAASVLTITITNPNTTAITGAAFTDTYPAGIVNTATPGAAVNGAGCAGAPSAAAGGGSVSLAAGVIPASSSCTVTVNVTGSTAGTYNNTLAIGAVTTANA